MFKKIVVPSVKNISWYIQRTKNKTNLKLYLSNNYFQIQGAKSNIFIEKKLSILPIILPLPEPSCLNAASYDICASCNFLPTISRFSINPTNLS